MSFSTLSDNELRGLVDLLGGGGDPSGGDTSTAVGIDGRLPSKGMDAGAEYFTS